MTTMLATWRGRCRACGMAILQGTVMDWTREDGATHVSPEACAEAVANPPVERVLRGPQPEQPADRARIEALLLGHLWKRATSAKYEKLPHAYTLRRTWASDEEFIWTVEYIRRVGYEQQFIGRVWVYYDIGEWQFWDCGGPVSGVGLINRAVRRPAPAPRPH